MAMQRRSRFGSRFGPPAAADQRRPTKVGDTLGALLQRIDPDQRMKAFRVWTFWDAEVGESVARHAQPDGFRAGVLSVRVDGSVWMQELQFLKESLRSRLNQRLGEPLIRDIYFVSGKPLTRTKPAAAPPPPVGERAAAPPMPMPRLRNKEIAEVFKRIAARRARRREPGTGNWD